MKYEENPMRHISVESAHSKMGLLGRKVPSVLEKAFNFNLLPWNAHSSPGQKEPVNDVIKGDPGLPSYYNVREEYPLCGGENMPIHDQGSCGACWAFTSAGHLADRICI